jgi:hypothetical protein
VGAGGGSKFKTVTETDPVVAAELLALHERPNDVDCTIGPTVSEPVTDFVPDHPPEAEQEVPLEVQVRIVL